MTNLGVVKLLKQEHDRLTVQVRGVSAALAAFGVAYRKRNGRSKMSAAGRERIAEAQRQRWAKLKAKNRKRTMSAAARKKIAAAQRLRWAKVKNAAK